MAVVTMDALPGLVEGLDAVDEQLVRQSADRAWAEGLELIGEGGLLARSRRRWHGRRAGFDPGSRLQE
ncbi:MAG: hypothetical protein ACRDRX_27520 [Pseudonocardiaceae bacterium]